MRAFVIEVVILFLFVVFCHCVAYPLPPSCLKVDDLTAGKHNPAEGEWLVATDNRNPKFSWRLEHKGRNVHQTKARIEMSNKADFSELVWDSGVMDSSLQYTYFNGKSLKSGQAYYFKVTWWDHNDEWAESEETGCFIMGLFNDEWNNALWITARSIPNAPYIRKEFSLSQAIKTATLYISGLGWYQLSINGHDVRSRTANATETIFITPGWSQYEIRIPYVAYSVHHLLKENASNVIGVILGGGWHDPLSFTNRDFPDAQEDKLLLRCILQIIDVMGTAHFIVSDDSWLVAPSPIVSDSLYNGETFNASMVQPGWNAAQFDASSWKKADKGIPPAGNMSLFLVPDIIEVETHEPIKVYTVKDTQVVDFGTNTAGVCVLKVSDLTPNTVVELRHAEVPLHDPYGPLNGSLYYANLLSAKATDLYISSSNSKTLENTYYQPAFTYHGFRYAQVKGYPSKLNSSNIVRKQIHSAIKLNGAFNTSSEILNAIQDIVVRGQSSNMMSIPTDCDQRNERLGWMGDAGLSADSMALNFDISAFHVHFLQLINDESQNGSIPDVVPFFRYGYRPGDPSWSSAFPHIVWTLYKYYGDLDTAKKYLPNLLEYFQFMVSKIPKDGLIDYYGFYGDWVPPPPQKKIAISFTSSFSLLMGIKEILEIAEAIKDAKATNTLKHYLKSLSSLFNAAFLKDSVYLNGTEITYSLPLTLGVVPSEITNDFINKWMNVLNDNDHHVASGIIGTKFLFPALSSVNKTDIGMMIAEQVTYPSWGYMITNRDEPATTVWELWNSNSAGPGMNSRNHHMYSSISGWLRTELVGLTMPSGSYGYNNIDLYPARVLDLSYAGVSQEWPKKISFKWERIGGMQCVKSVATSTESRHHPMLRDHAKITCANGAVIKRIDFASYGTPSGLCGNYVVSDECHHPASLAYVEDMCVGRSECSVPLWIEKWGDPCPEKEIKWLQVQAQCNDTEHIYHSLKIDPVIPVNSQANLYVPIHNHKAVQIREGNSLIWNGSELDIKEVNIVLVANVDDNNVRLQFGSGSYNFVVEEKQK